MLDGALKWLTDITVPAIRESRLLIAAVLRMENGG